MANTVKMKRSAVPGKVPATTDLDLGEIAINTYDGKAYIKKNVSGTESIVPLGGAGSGDVTGPNSSTDNAIARFDGVSGKIIQNSTGTIDDSGNASLVSLSLTTDLAVTHGGTGASTAADARTNLGAQATLVSGTNIKTINSTSLLGRGNIAIPTGDVVGPASATDNAIARFDATTGKLIQSSGGSIDDNGNLTATTSTANGTGANKMPVGTTAQRPTGAIGLYRMNSTTGEPEWWSAVQNAWVPFGERLEYPAEILVVAGGGGGGSSHGGGGGAGGYRTTTQLLKIGQSFSVVVGGGGAGGASGGSNKGSNGNTSTFDATSSTGGGGGGAYASNSVPKDGISGGSGGGGGGSPTAGTGGAGTSGQGFAGGNGSTNGTAGGGGGGGGASVTGTAASGISGGAGGAGNQWLNSNYYGGGGGGGGWVGNGGTSASGGIGGGGAGGPTSNSAGLPGTANTGGGGGGASDFTAGGGNGGSGVVILRYLGEQRGTGGTVTSSGGHTYHTFTTSGTYTA